MLLRLVCAGLLAFVARSASAEELMSLGIGDATLQAPSAATRAMAEDFVTGLQALNASSVAKQAP